ncbi:MAG: sulfurtransferase [Gammaproteobacteria bacterium]|nr:sulfurtransferase [Gammaproteobacteria bacterium]
MTFTTLIDPNQLAEHLDDPQWVIIDCRFTLTDPEAGRRAYRENHIPGACYAHLNEDLSAPATLATGRHPLPHTALFASKLGAWGVDANKQVVVYDSSFGAMAARLWWLLRWLGHHNVALLNGGFPRWQREGLPITATVSSPRTSTFQPHLNPSLAVNADDVERIRRSSNYRLFDARAEERFSGAVEPLDKIAGHIPGAINLPWDDNLDLGGNFQTAEELRASYGNQLGDVVPEHVIHMCGSGVTACHNILAMEHAGLHGTKLYAGSWSEWITDPHRSVAKD